jgi:hypothetical protein
MCPAWLATHIQVRSEISTLSMCKLDDCTPNSAVCAILDDYIVWIQVHKLLQHAHGRHRAAVDESRQCSHLSVASRAPSTLYSSLWCLCCCSNSRQAACQSMMARRT